MKRRLAREWLVLVACVIIASGYTVLVVEPGGHIGVDFWITALIGGFVIGIPSYLGVGVIRLTVAAARTMSR